MVPAMKTGIPCVHIFTGKICFNHKGFHSPCWEPASPLSYPVLTRLVWFRPGLLPCTGLQCKSEEHSFIKIVISLCLARATFPGFFYLCNTLPKDSSNSLFRSSDHDNEIVRQEKSKVIFFLFFSIMAV